MYQNAKAIWKDAMHLKLRETEFGKLLLIKIGVAVPKVLKIDDKDSVPFITDD